MILYYNDFQITHNFNSKEFHCKSGVRVPHEYINNIVYVATQLQKIRFRLDNATIRIHSGFRTQAHNRAIGGVPKSNHLTGQAVDISTQKYTAEELYKKIRSFVKLGLIPDGEIIRYSTFVHYAPQFDPRHTQLVESYF